MACIVTRLISAQKSSVSLSALLTRKSDVVVTKYSGRICVLANKFSLSRILPEAKRLGSAHVKLSYKVMLGLIPAGTYLALNATSVRFVCNLSQLFPFWVKAHCQSSVIIKPSEQHHQLTFRQSASKLVIKIWKNFVLCVHFLKLCLTFGPLLLFYPLTLLSDRLFTAWLTALFHVVQFSGPVYVKLGQWASTRRDLFCAEFCEQFSQLHQKVQPHEWRHTEHALCVAYGKRWHELLKIDKTQKLLGSGCVAQVYKGYIHTKNLCPETLAAFEDMENLDDVYFRDGVEIQNLIDSLSLPEELITANKQFADDPDYVAVAVKVLHPKIHERFSRDLILMSMMAQFLELMIPSLRWINLRECVQEFSISMTKQMDMIHEARCMKHLNDDFANMTSIRIPVPIIALVRHNILVESFEEGQPIGDFIENKADLPKGLRQKLADIGVDALMQMVFIKNFVHGDLHPGNILVQNADTFQEQTEDSLVMVDVGDVIVTSVSQQSCPLRLVLLDCGITTSLEGDDRSKFIEVFTAVVKGQGEVVADLFLQRSHHVECSDPDAFRQDMADIVNKARKTALQLSKIKVSVLLSEVFSVLSRHRVKLESNFANIIIAIAILEGLGRSLDPNLDILSRAKGVLLGEMMGK